ncbi:LPS export ABC transporter permease LptF [Pseudobdellovibrio exovorus]|uniref:YjgP/YjgQ permease n=1 Tax=Pseudobdellovibrio exovorus JSS TaxID=1184267 RepID=M4V722_9BACT|nr:LPS export ABC transporter permease LptF [Pseudobdellovibrio exovorus]AGH95192.1 YjgP/YjgQ permease [Pseudobdellovibrio exovorus JSS]
MFKNRRVFAYILSEIVPSFLLGVFIFICVLLMFQALRLTEFLLIHGIKWTTMVRIMGYMSISFLPLLLPMSLLFAVLLTYNRFSQDSEIIAFKSSGVNPWSIAMPAIAFSLFVTLVSSQTSFYLAPWGNRQFEVLINRLGNTKAAASIKEGTFSEGFFDLVVYSNKVNSQTGVLNDLFIYDEKNPNAPLTIVAAEGQIIPDTTHPGHSVLLRLFNGQIHRKGESHTVINFNTYDVLLNDPIRLEEKKKSPSSLNLEELLTLRKSNEDITPEMRKDYDIEYHKRSALSAACFVFGILGLAFGIVTNRRSGKSSGFILSVGFIILYWVVYLSFESLVRSNQIPTGIGLWLPNILFTLFGLYHLKKVWD